MIKEAGIHLPEMHRTHFDSPFGDASGAGLIFGATGGVMEAAIRTIVEFITGNKTEDVFKSANVIQVRGFDDIKYYEIPLGDKFGKVPDLISHLVPDWNWLTNATLKVAVAHGTANAKKNNGRY